ncbi:hypothetical protein FGF66_10410 [Chlorobaculum thiosulfatiphilum]|uniref:Fibrobacter succinogenes major paralogous domain-containing protein n=1 Tax=Chlorobaculum thiosulfatiphilum TaxID=115852 RepID=A0A5C4S252_CHLTI|nr:fibrobacter succinogenes major paralogous domain-containing protein [Chlorobaculum thiosulfatiphilum]TNJ37556.1 hypothetical protein FGF66_10410 [Chlorobaculum thiosulfatiphilum]
MRKKQRFVTGFFALALIIMMFAHGIASASPLEITDIDGNRYKTVTIGTQVWTQTNLNVTHYRNGDPIRYAKTAKEWYNAAQKGEGAWAFYNNAPGNGKKYGRLYNWYAVNDPRGLAPKGSHVPSDKEWSVLTEELGGEALAGGKMKAVDSVLWEKPNAGAENESEFNAHPGGLCGINGNFYFVKKSAYFWSSSEYSPKMAHYRLINFHVPSIINSAEEKRDGMSVRCIVD